MLKYTKSRGLMSAWNIPRTAKKSKALTKQFLSCVSFLRLHFCASLAMPESTLLQAHA